jgi:hypothetical protein
MFPSKSVSSLRTRAKLTKYWRIGGPQVDPKQYRPVRQPHRYLAWVPFHKTKSPPFSGLLSNITGIENLERAKGLEPSTPTLARSCSTTELHPHPGWRRSRAGNGRPMPNAHCECNSPKIAKSGDRGPMTAKRPRNSGKGPLIFRRHGFRGTLPAHAVRRDSSHFETPSLACMPSTMGRRAAYTHPISDRTEGPARSPESRLKFVAKPPFR